MYLSSFPKYFYISVFQYFELLISVLNLTFLSCNLLGAIFEFAFCCFLSL